METKKNPSKDIYRYRSLFLLVGVSTSLGIMITAFQWTTAVLPKATRPEQDDYTEIFYNVPATAQPEPKSPEMRVAAKVPSIVRLVEVSDETSENSNLATATAPPADSVVFQVGEPEPEDTEVIFVGPEEMPVPEGGYESFYQSIANKLKYPQRAIRAGIEGKVFIQFTVRKDGTVTDLNVLKGIGFGCDEEALKLLSTLKWQPGKQRGKTCTCKDGAAAHFQTPLNVRGPFHVLEGATKPKTLK